MSPEVKKGTYLKYSNFIVRVEEIENGNIKKIKAVGYGDICGKITDNETNLLNNLGFCKTEDGWVLDAKNEIKN